MLTSLQALLRLATLRWLGVFVCALATLLAAANTASAHEPLQTKTRVWGFESAEHNSVGLFRAATAGKHQGNCSARAEAASGSLLAARGAKAGVDAFSSSGREVVKNGLTRAGHAYQKHMGRGELPNVAGRDLNSAGQNLLDGILTNPQTKQVAVSAGNFSGGTRFIGPDGAGATFDAKGIFQYFGVYP